MFIHSALLFILSVLSATTIAQPGIPPAQITPTPTNFQDLSIRGAKKSPVTVSTKPTPYPSVVHSSPAHSGTYPSTDSLCAPGLNTAIDAAFKNEAGYKMTITCLPSYGATNDTYVYLNMVVPAKDQGAALIRIVKTWAPSWASPIWNDPRTLVPADATCPEDASLCQPQQLPLGYCLSGC
ncbi:hypothetical protein OCU04_003464 [Sclerotinia nivalis]|uniref:Uncharacterized protein n=1 Tax=Sclerotinia nivalis TaxID=352851 RepID=A0A9X0DN86_9HELO|nr:hypothetical protein OCU04_003464 [Sclerotinia nivalis]